MEFCNHCHYNKPLSHFYKNDKWNLNHTISSDIVLAFYSGYKRTNHCINCYNHPNESECPCYKSFKETHEFPRRGKDEKITYHKELQKLIKNCPRTKQNLNHALIKSVRNFKLIIPIFESADLFKEIALDRLYSSS